MRKFNCIIIDDETLSRKAIEHLIRDNNSLNLLQSFSDPVTALSFITENKVDLIFLDIEMPQMSGIEFLGAMPKAEAPEVVLITSHKKYALDAFDYNVTDYLIKPISYARFYKAIEKVQHKQAIIFENKPYDNESNMLFIKKGGSVVKVNTDDILWVEALGDYIILNTAEEKFTMHHTMKEMESILPDKKYMRVHRSYIVRLDKINRIDDLVIFCGGKEIPVGKSYRESFFKRLNIL